MEANAHHFILQEDIAQMKKRDEVWQRKVNVVFFFIFNEDKSIGQVVLSIVVVVSAISRTIFVAVFIYMYIVSLSSTIDYHA